MTQTKDTIKTALNAIALPNGQGLDDAGAIRQVEVQGSSVRVLLVLPELEASVAAAVKAQAEALLSTLDDVEQFRVDSPTGTPFGQQQQAPPPPGWADKVKGIRHIVAVASGKGGVGKSTVAANLALALAQQELAVGLLDADIYGPSQQLILGASEPPLANEDGTISPLQVNGIAVMSFGYLIDADQPVIWRGPMLMKALEQFIGDVTWGELDYLVIDLPPGTGDIALTLCQNVPLAGAIIVTTPQDVALIDARKGLHMFTKLGVPVLGIVENMSHFACPSCGHIEHIFGKGGGERTALQLGIPFLGALPLDPEIVAGGDSGRPAVLEHPDSPAAQGFTELAIKVSKGLET